MIKAETPGWSASSRFGAVMRLLDLHPATLAVWLARKAGEAYRDGNFFPNLSADTDIDFSTQDQRRKLAQGLTRACRRVMNNFAPPPDGAHFIHMEPCLFHAGLPLCHCGTFSEAVRWVERHAGLASPDEADAGELLREQALRFPWLGNVPILKKALAGPAGAMICETALRVVFEQDYGAINPCLGEALAVAFAHVRPEQLRRSARPPFLRLGADLASFEIIGPRQERGVASGSGIVWRINDVSERVGFQEELVFPVPAAAAQVRVELRGLADGRALQREFVLDCAAREMPLLLFERESRRERVLDAGATVTVRAGDYIVVHPSDAQLEGGELLTPWPDGAHATSALALRPGQEARLIGKKETVFQPAQAPFLDLTGTSVRTDDLQRIHYGWRALPEVWCPGDADVDGWTLRVSAGDAEQSWALSADGEAGRLRPFTARGSEAFLNALRPGLHRLRISVSRAGRRAELEETLWYWSGLAGWREGEHFELVTTPANLRRDLSAGFAFEPNAIRHRSDGNREHVLTFFLGDELPRFRWTRAGLFLEALERRAGVAIQPKAYPIPHTFSAAADSIRHLRIWLVPPDDAELLANGKFVEQFGRRTGRSFVELSLATLSTHHAQGRIALRRHGVETIIAHFTRPLVPRIVSAQSCADYLTLLCKFEEPVEWVRPRVRELISGALHACEGARFDGSGHAIFSCEGLPAIECANIAPDPLTAEATLFRVSLDVPRRAWPAGVWMIELDVRRDEASGWQPLLDTMGGCLCVVHGEPPETAPTEFRTSALWWAFGQAWHGKHLPEEMPRADGSADALCALLDELTALLARGFNEHAWARLRILESLHSRLGREAARLLGKDDAALAARLLECAARETNPKRSLFTAIPELLAVRAENYRELPPMNPLLESLRWCGELTAQARVADSLQPPLGELIDQVVRGRQTGLFRVLQNFRRQPDGGAIDFARFDVARYWQSVIGAITDADREHAASLDFLPEESLGREHALCALAKWWRRRERGEGGAGLAEAHTVFYRAGEFGKWLNQRLGTHWFEPWLHLDFDEDALTVEACRFMSVFALACRAAAAGHLPFSEVLDWLYERHHAAPIGKTFTTLVALGPELFGYHLMLWELIFRTPPHD